MKKLPSFIKIENYMRDLIDSVINELGYITPKYVVTVNHNQNFGDYSTNVAILLAKQIGVSSYRIAENLVKLLRSRNLSNNISNLKAEENGFINFWVDDYLLLETLSYIIKEPFPFKGLDPDDNIYIVEYSSPNMVKPFTIGYLRSTIVGESVANILAYCGKKIIRDNHLGDWGVQFGKLISAIHIWSSREMIESSKNPYLELISLYLKFVKEEKLDSNLTKLATIEYQKLESGDTSSLDIWQWMRQILITGINKIYERLQLKFDVFSWESLFVEEARSIVKKLILSEVAVISKDATVVFFENLPPLVLSKGDGTTLYASREIACDVKRKYKYGQNIVIINEVGSDQNTYFEQIFSIEMKMGLFQNNQRIHLSHGMYNLEGMKMVSEKGNYIYLEDVLNFAKNTILAKFPNTSDYDAEIIGQAIIRFNDLKNPPINDVVFNMNTFTNVGKGSGPYLQYTLHRARLIKEVSYNKSIPELIDSEERKIIRHLQKGYKYFENSQKELSIHHIANFASELAYLYNAHYGNKLTVEHSCNTHTISHCTEKMLSICLMLLGIKIPGKM